MCFKCKYLNLNKPKKTCLLGEGGCTILFLQMFSLIFFLHSFSAERLAWKNSLSSPQCCRQPPLPCMIQAFCFKNFWGHTKHTLLYKGQSCCSCCFKVNAPHFPLKLNYSQAGTELIISRQQHLSVGLNSAVSNTGKSLCQL